jgi:hypothetical protein
MNKALLLTFFIFFPHQLMAMDSCGKEVNLVASGEDGRFFIEKNAQHTDWVKMRFIIDKDGSITDPKPMGFSRDLYINMAHERIKLMAYSNSGKSCYKDLVLYQVLSN